MKKRIFTSGLAFAMVAGLFAFSTTQSGIMGKVMPADGVEMVWAINGTDSMKTTLSAGAFSFSAKPGTYKVIIDAKEPYKDMTFETVEVKEGESTDLGEIALQP